jgi:hypothetical protein
MVDEFKQGRDPYDRFADRALEEIWKYFQSRSDIVLKIVDEPEIKDLRASLIKLDLSFIHKLKLSLVQTRNQAYHPSGFRVYCPGGRRDLKPDYRISGFGAVHPSITLG